MSERVIPVSIEVAPLIKTVAAQQIDQFARWAADEMATEGYPVAEDNMLHIMSVRNDRALKQERGTIRSYGRAGLAFAPNFFTDLNELHEAQARTAPGWLSNPYGKFVVEEVRQMAQMPNEFVTDRIDWRLNPEEKRLTSKGLRLPSDMDTPGELAVCLYDSSSTDTWTERHLARLLLFNGLGGDEMIMPPAVAGIYQINQAE